MTGLTLLVNIERAAVKRCGYKEQYSEEIKRSHSRNYEFFLHYSNFL